MTTTRDIEQKVRLTELEFKVVKHHALARGISVEGFIRRAIQEHIRAVDEEVEQLEQILVRTCQGTNRARSGELATA